MDGLTSVLKPTNGLIIPILVKEKTVNRVPTNKIPNLKNTSYKKVLQNTL